MENIDKKKLLDAVTELKLSGKLADALKNHDMNAALSSLPSEQAEQIKKIMSDKSAMERLLSSQQAQNIMRALRKDGK